MNISRLTDILRDTAITRTICGKPYESDGKTIIPVARMVCENGDSDADWEEKIKAAGFIVLPVGLLEIEGETTRFIRYEEE